MPCARPTYMLVHQSSHRHTHTHTHTHLLYQMNTSHYNQTSAILVVTLRIDGGADPDHTGDLCKAHHPDALPTFGPTTKNQYCQFISIPIQLPTDTAAQYPTPTGMCGYPWDPDPYSSASSVDEPKSESESESNLICSDTKQQEDCLQSTYQARIQCQWYDPQYCSWNDNHNHCNTPTPFRIKTWFNLLHNTKINTNINININTNANTANTSSGSACLDQITQVSCENTIYMDSRCGATFEYSRNGGVETELDIIEVDTTNSTEYSLCSGITDPGLCRNSRPFPIGGSCAWYGDVREKQIELQTQTTELSLSNETFTDCCWLPSPWCESIGRNYTLANARIYIGSNGTSDYICDDIVGSGSTFNRSASTNSSLLVRNADALCCNDLSPLPDTESVESKIVESFSVESFSAESNSSVEGDSQVVTSFVGPLMVFSGLVSWLCVRRKRSEKGNGGDVGDVVDPSRYEHVTPGEPMHADPHYDSFAGNVVDGEDMDPTMFEHVAPYDDSFGGDVIDPSRFEHVPRPPVYEGLSP